MTPAHAQRPWSQPDAAPTIAEALEESLELIFVALAAPPKRPPHITRFLPDEGAAFPLGASRQRCIAAPAARAFATPAASLATLRNLSSTSGVENCDALRPCGRDEPGRRARHADRPDERATAPGRCAAFERRVASESVGYAAGGTRWLDGGGRRAAE